MAGAAEKIGRGTGVGTGSPNGAVTEGGYSDPRGEPQIHLRARTNRLRPRSGIPALVGIEQILNALGNDPILRPTARLESSLDLLQSFTQPGNFAGLQPLTQIKGHPDTPLQLLLDPSKVGWRWRAIRHAGADLAYSAASRNDSPSASTYCCRNAANSGLSGSAACSSRSKLGSCTGRRTEWTGAADTAGG